MKAGWIATGLLVPAVLGMVAYAHSLDPRPRADALRGEIRTAVAEITTLGTSGLGEAHAFSTFVLAVRETAGSVAAASLPFLEDANVRDFAERQIAAADDSVSPAAERGDAAALDAILNATLTAVATGIAHKGAPDEIFIQTMLALHQGAVQAATLTRSSATDTSQVAAIDDVLLTENSAVGSMTRWLRFSPHDH